MQIIPKQFRDLASPDSSAIAFLATTMPDGSPIISPVWFGAEGEDTILIVTGADSIKGKNMVARPQVSVVLQDPNDKHRYVQLRGHFAERVDDSQQAMDMLDAFSRRYTGVDYPERLPHESIFKIKVERVNTFHWSLDQFE